MGLERLHPGYVKPLRRGSFGSPLEARHSLQTTMKQSEPIKRRLLTIHEVAQYTGLSVHALYTMVSQRRIPCVKVGRLTKFDVGLLDAWIKQHTVMPMPSKKP